MADQVQDNQMEGVEQPLDKGKGKASDPQVEESADDDSSDESGVEDQAPVEVEDDDNMEEIDTSNIVGSRTRGKNIDFAKANQELGEDEDEEDDEDYEGEDAMEE
ncbi:hypothetical protein BU24DRAFT_409682 [Aaosphaeria arxii CBS 175.79]|uniref:Histone chaperone domain-containing protein n=1 Tax=Aaosphaeria arxii CBS 175.79 TaxID=1450172 RepID=A0A6A5XTS4_9PLEO|nr:uncharacterized protein BU24DRAFT_409682 [Aaosphaeria arxii CBS 175.79]KAF2016592.1 hypothetical protein BU24DRAFT_409682 [Aaosphaeria arxii CBS 175.79]